MTTVKRGFDFTMKSVTCRSLDQPSHRVATVSHGSCRPESRRSVGRRGGERESQRVTPELKCLGDVPDANLFAIGEICHSPGDPKQPVERPGAEGETFR